MPLGAVQSHLTTLLLAYVRRESDKLVSDKATATYPCYQNHFGRTKTAINNAFEGINATTALILGVGAAQDIDLMALAKAFEKVRLIDIDLRQTKKALTKQIPEDDLRAKFELEEADLSGILTELSREAEKLAAQKDLIYDQFVCATLDLLPTLKPEAFPYKHTQSSFVCSSLVSTQLVGTLIGYLNTLAQKAYGKTFAPPKHREEEFNNFLSGIIQAHLSELSLLVSPSGRIYYADHFTAKTIVHIEHPVNPEIENYVGVRGEQGYAFTGNLAERIQKIFSVVSLQQWGWALPVRKSVQIAELTDDNGTVEEIPIIVTEFNEFQVSSYVLKRAEITE